ncbi:MAG: hypothetical protein Q9167_006674 [Letrouitia subvulpina]
MEHSDSGISAAAILEPNPSSSSETVAVFQPYPSKDAWLFFCAAFTVEALVWGLPLSYGVFQQYYGTHGTFNSNRNNIAIVGALALGALYFNAPFVMGACKQFPFHRRRMTVLGLLLLISSLIAASFTTAVWQLILAQGLLYAIGGTFLYIPTLILLDECLTLFLGITSAGTGVGGVVIPPVMSWALLKYGMNTALRIWAVSINSKVVFTGPLLPFIKPRIPVSSNLGITWSREIDFGFLRHPIFWFMQTGNVVQGAGYLIPTIFLPDFACSIGLSTLTASFTLSLLNASSVIGQIIFGRLSGKYNVTNVIIVSTLGSAASVFLLWGFSTSIYLLYAFSIAYGFFAGGLSSCWISGLHSATSLMCDPLQAASEYLETAKEQLELVKVQYQSAEATYEKAKSLYKAIESSQSRYEQFDKVSNLCESCAAIQIATTFRRQSTSKPHRRKVGDLFHAIENQSSCIFCKFLIDAFQIGSEDQAERLHAHLTPRDTSVYFAQDREDKAWYTKAGIDTNLPACPFVWLQTGPPTATGEPHICISFVPSLENGQGSVNANKSLYPRQRSALEAFNGSLNYDILKFWLEKCHTIHGAECQLNNTLSTLPLDIYLIDVQTRRLIRRNHDDRFVALSYVWGKGTSTSYQRTSNQTLPASIPQTMEDAITFTKRIGERYLWIDQLCIDQMNNEEKHQQIDIMDQIFASADLTIINLDGQDADWGLPGVSRPLLQTQQPTVRLRAGQLMATYIYSIWDNNGNSIWDSRGWTLQERLLSRRCIMFAKSSISMICRTEFFHDSVPMDSEGKGVRTWLGDDYFREDGSGINLDEEEWDFKNFDALVSVFTSRELTFQSDALNACQGSLNRMSHKTGYAFCFGLPIRDFLRALIWKPHHEHVLTRRNEFPSWSWLGWSSRIEYSYWVGDMAGYLNEDSDELSYQQSPPSKRRRTQPPDPNSLQPDSANVISYPDEGSLLLQIDSTVVKFKLRLMRKHGDLHRNLKPNSQQSNRAVGDHWTLLGSDGHVLRDVAGEHPRFELTDAFFRLKPEYSEILAKQNNEAELIFIEQWPRIRDSAASNKWLYNMVSALLVIRNPDGTAWRLASVLLKSEDWQAKSSQREVLSLV